MRHHCHDNHHGSWLRTMNEVAILSLFGYVSIRRPRPPPSSPPTYTCAAVTVSDRSSRFRVAASVVVIGVVVFCPADAAQPRQSPFAAAAAAAAAASASASAAAAAGAGAVTALLLLNM